MQLFDPDCPLPAITAFSGPYAFLSNFFIEPDKTHVEGEFQSAKCVDLRQATKIITMNPRESKKAGQRVRIRPDWESVKVEVMRGLVCAKFVDHDSLASLLVRTYPRQLVEGNTWGDKFWGVCDGVGLNHLGVILMEVRGVLMEQKMIESLKRYRVRS
jgi:ribA/ribD-fused uncharacterized protein